MATEAQIAKSKKKPAFRTRVVRRCKLCGRKGGYMRYFDLCRICFREHAEQGHLPGVRRSSW
jgi:small subunit ribosomal protein S14